MFQTILYDRPQPQGSIRAPWRVGIKRMGPIGRRHRRGIQEYICKKIPRIYLPIKNILIKCVRLLKHISKISGVRHVPTTDVLIEALRNVKHSIEIVYILHIPLRNVLIEGLRILEHPIQRERVAHIPLRNVTIEGGPVQKHMGEIGHIAHIPPGDRAES